MYLKHFKLDEHPFSDETSQRFFFESAQVQNALELAIEDVAKPVSMVVITGENELGKSTLCKKIVDKISITNTVISVGRKLKNSEQLLLKIARKLRIPTEDSDPSWLAGTIKTCLEKLSENGKTVVLVADDCQYLAPNVMSAMIKLAKLRKNENALMKILATCDVAFHKTPEFQQATTLNFTLAPLRAGEVASYIDHRISLAGSASNLVQFTPEAKSRVAELSSGFPGRINALCEKMLTAACNQSIYTIDQNIIEMVSAVGPVKEEKPEPIEIIEPVKPVAKKPVKTLTSYDERLIAFADPADEKSRQFKAVRDNLCAGKTAGVWIVTSSSQGDGKTITAGNLGVTFAEFAEKKTLLIEASFGGGQTLSGLFNYSKIDGVAQVLTGHKTLKQTVKPTALNNLYLLSAGPGFDAPTSLSRLNPIIDQARTMYDFIIIDAPDLSQIPKEVLAHLDAQFVIATRLNHTKASDLQHASTQLKNGGAKTAGLDVSGV